MDKRKIAQPSNDELRSASPPSEKGEDVAGISNFIILDLEEDDEGSYECCRVC
jgi:hypothetical protein